MPHHCSIFRLKTLLLAAGLLSAPLFSSPVDYRDESLQIDRLIEFSIQSTNELNQIKEQYQNYLLALEAVKKNPNDKSALMNLVRTGSVLYSSITSAKLQKNFSAELISELNVLKQFAERGNG